MSNPKYSVVVVHGIGAGTGKEREGFSKDLKAGVVKCNPECETLWFEAPWEGNNDSVDTVVKEIAGELLDSYIRDAEDEKKRTEQWAAEQDTSSRWWILRTIKKICVGLKKGISGATPDALRKAKQITPNVLDAVLDLPIYLGHHGQDIRNAVFKKINEAMSKEVDGVVLVGHSLGSVIAFDVLLEELKNQNEPRIKALVTMGSPLEWVAKIRCAMDNIAESPAFDVHGTKWINYYDPQDPVPLRRALNRDIFNEVENVEEVSKKALIDAHCAYWKSQMIAQRVVDLMCGIL